METLRIRLQSKKRKSQGEKSLGGPNSSVQPWIHLDHHARLVTTQCQSWSVKIN